MSNSWNNRPDFARKESEREWDQFTVAVELLCREIAKWARKKIEGERNNWICIRMNVAIGGLVCKNGILSIFQLNAENSIPTVVRQQIYHLR